MKEIHKILEDVNVPSLLAKERAQLSSHPGYTVSFRRFFLSDRKQMDEFPKMEGPVSFIVQPPLDGNTIAEWLFLTADTGTELIWTAGAVSAHGSSEEQTRDILEKYGSDLEAHGLNMADNCIRTWFFVHDIDNNYAGLVKARREDFALRGLRPDTHFLASNGICGTPVVEGATVQMDALAVRGDFDQHYLYARTHMNPTYEYGVTFERGVCVDFEGSRHTLISGTASIDDKGEIVHPGDIAAQTLRMWDNVSALLQEAGAGWRDVVMMLVYLRNADDYATVAPLFAGRFHAIPYVVTLAPVCRPGWLIEMECVAVHPICG